MLFTKFFDPNTAVALFGLLVRVTALNSNSASLTSASPSPSLSINTVCEARTINYITHGLPSLCLRNGRIGVLTHSRIDVTTTSFITSSQPVQATTTSEASSSPVSTVATPSVSLPQESTEDDTGAFDEASFLSFEEWKKQTQEKAGQEVDKRKRDGSQETLEAANDDNTIDIDVHAIIGDRQGRPRASPPRTEEGRSGLDEVESSDTELQVEKRRYRSKDAGKTCKERFNFASVDAGGQVMKSNPEAKHSSSLLSENRDAYMLNICQARNKFIIVELSDSIYVETVALANFEFFSSTFRQFRISVSAKYPVKLDKWKVLGTFEAQNIRDIQAFLVESPLIEARYLRIEFLNHYGNEFYCPVSLLRVHGQTMLQEVMSWERAASGEEDEDDELETENSNSVEKPGEEDKVADDTNDAVIETNKETKDMAKTKVPDDITLTQQTQADSQAAQMRTPWHEKSLDKVALFNIVPEAVCTSLDAPQPPISSDKVLPQGELGSSGSSNDLATAPKDELNAIQDASRSLTSLIATPIYVETSKSGNTIKTSSDTIASPPTAAPSVKAQNATSANAQKSATVNSNQAAAKSTRSTGSSAPQPTTQESFFKTVTKRLQLLEANSTLSLKYIEEQSRILREAFNKVERRQLSKTTLFLENLNNTVITELRKFSQEYDQLWQSTVIELETQRDHSKRETAAVTARLNMLADELVFQKRMSIVQSILLLLCLVLVVFSKGVAGGYIDVPAIQNMLAKSRSPSTATFGFDSLTGSPVTRRESLFYNRLRWQPSHRRQSSADSGRSMRIRSREVSPPIPSATYPRSEEDLEVYEIDRSHRENPVRSRLPGRMEYGDDDTAIDDNLGYNWNEMNAEPMKAFHPSVPPVLETGPIVPQQQRLHSNNTFVAPRIEVNLHEPCIPATTKPEFPQLAEHPVMEEVYGSTGNLTSEATIDSRLPSPPPDGEDLGFAIARKPLPALPNDP